MHPSQVVGSLYNIGQTGRLGMGIAVRCNVGSFAGVWASEFVLDSVNSNFQAQCGITLPVAQVGMFLGQLQDGLHGTLFLASADSTGCAMP